MISVGLLAVLAYALFRLGYFEGWGNEPPVRYLLSAPELVSTASGETARYWLHVPNGTDSETTFTLIGEYLIPQIESGAIGVTESGERVTADRIEFQVYWSEDPETGELKVAGEDTADAVFVWRDREGLSGP